MTPHALNLPSLCLPSLCLVGILSFLTAIPAPAQLVPLIDSGDGWKVLDNGTTPASNWKTNSFIETAPLGWRGLDSPFLPSPFGYKVANGVYDENGATTLLNFNAGNVIANPTKFITTYFRKNFTLTAAQATGASRITDLILGLNYDDGLVVYINGTEVSRENLPIGSAITNSTLALSNVDAYGFSHKTIPVVSGVLLEGNNTIAVEVHQADPESSDLYFDLDLTGSQGTPCFGDAAVGIYQDFETNFEEDFQFPPHFGFFTRTLDKTLLRYDAIAQDISTNLNQVQLFQSTYPGTSKQILFPRNTNFSLTTERVDTQNYKNVKASVELRSELPPGASWSSSDFIKGTLSYSNDAVNYTNVPWFSYQQSNTPPPVTTTLLAETAPYFWMVPAINIIVNPTASTNPTDWMNQTPTGWTAPNVPPAGAFWTNGNLPATTTKGGAGFDDNLTVNYTPHMDGGSASSMRSKLYNKETRVNLRIPFNVSGSIVINNITQAILTLRYDDAAAVWINGAEYTHADLAKPANDTALPPDRGDQQGITPRSFDITTIFKANVLSGSTNNILALRAFNSSKTSNDLLLQSKLTIVTQGTSGSNPTPASLQTPGNMITVDTGTLIPAGVRSVKFKIEGSIPSNTDFKKFFVDNFRVSGDPISALNLGSTVALQLPSSTYPEELRTVNADAEFDGISNLLEYAFGGHCALNKQFATLSGGATQSILPIISQAPGGFLRLQFRAIPGAIENDFSADAFIAIRDLYYKPEISMDLQDNWTSLGAFILDPNNPVFQNSDGTQTITILTQNAYIGNDSKFFFRMRVIASRDPWLSNNYDYYNQCPFP